VADLSSRATLPWCISFWDCIVAKTSLEERGCQAQQITFYTCSLLLVVPCLLISTCLPCLPISDALRLCSPLPAPLSRLFSSYPLVLLGTYFLAHSFSLFSAFSYTSLLHSPLRPTTQPHMSFMISQLARASALNAHLPFRHNSLSRFPLAAQSVSYATLHILPSLMSTRSTRVPSFPQKVLSITLHNPQTFQAHPTKLPEWLHSQHLHITEVLIPAFTPHYPIYQQSRRVYSVLSTVLTLHVPSSLSIFFVPSDRHPSWLARLSLRLRFLILCQRF
jgi:hypothetical protein